MDANRFSGYPRRPFDGYDAAKDIRLGPGTKPVASMPPFERKVQHRTVVDRGSEPRCLQLVLVEPHRASQNPSGQISFHAVPRALDRMQAWQSCIANQAQRNARFRARILAAKARVVPVGRLEIDALPGVSVEHARSLVPRKRGPESQVPAEACCRKEVPL